MVQKKYQIIESIQQTFLNPFESEDIPDSPGIYGVKTITLNTKDVTELCRISNNVLTISDVKDAEMITLLHHEQESKIN